MNEVRERLARTFLLLMLLMSVMGYSVNFEWGNRPLDQILGIAAIFAAFGTVIMWLVWDLDVRIGSRIAAHELDETILEKRKRENLDSVLRDLSDADLLRLRQRLNDGTINDDALDDALIGEDGELLHKSRE